MRYTAIVGWLALVAFFCIVLGDWSSGQHYVDRTVSVTNGFITFEKEGKHSIHIRPEAITAFTYWAAHPEWGTPAISVTVGAKAYRIDCSTKTKAQQIEQFLLTQLGDKHGRP